VRSLLEGEAAVRAASRLAAPGDRRLRGLVAGMREAARQADRSTLFELDDAFHARLWELAGSATLTEMLRNLRARFAPLVRRSIDSMTDRELANMEPWHDAYLDALHAGSRAARAEARRHSELTRDRVLGLAATPTAGEAFP
jgi:DNA-binding GntR family transcriptional regulator